MKRIKRTKHPYLPQRQVGFYNRRPEIKRVDVAADNVFSTTPIFQTLNFLTIGSDDFQRIGREIKLKSLDLTIAIRDNRVQSNATDYLRYLVVYDRQTNGAVPTIANILTSVDLAGATTSTVKAAYNDDLRSRFKILLDKPIGIPNDTNNGATQAGQRSSGFFPTFVRHYIPLKGLITRYQANNGAIGDISMGSLILVLYGQNAAAAANYSCNFTSRLSYFDY